MSSLAARYTLGAFGKRVTSTPEKAEVSRDFAAEAASIKSFGLSGSTAATNSGAGVAQLDAPSDEDLMARVCEDEREALACLFRRYARAVRAVAYRVLRDTSEADDMVQDVFLLVHGACRAFDSSKGPARSWILQMTYRRAISRRRYLTSRHFYTRLDLDGAASELADPRVKAGQFEDSADGRLGNGGLQKAFEALSENQRQTLVLHFFEGRTFDEIATKLGQPKGNIRHHYFRGLEKLRKHIFDRKLQGH
jgi:RNA polymerase sigma-70 factor (ECF subfamily)